VITEHLLTFPGNDRLRSLCHIIVDTRRRWAIAGEIDDNPGTSVTNAIERIHSLVSSHWFKGDTKFLLFEYTQRDPITHAPAIYEIRWHGPTFTMPEWKRSERADQLLEEVGSRLPEPYVSASLKDAEPVAIGQIAAEPASPVSRSLLIGALDLPTDFPAREFDAAELYFRARTGTSVITPAATWAEFSSAWTAVAYRFMDVATFDEEFRVLLERYGTAPALPERYAQERALFGFFIAGLAAIESLSYGVSALAWEAGANEFALETDVARNRVSPERTVERLKRTFPDEAITRSLSDLIESEEFLHWVETRNALAHRSAPLRHHRVTISEDAISTGARESAWGLYTLNEDLTAARRRWLALQLRTLLRAAGAFAANCFIDPVNE
jgi:hypothetical protein